VRNSTGSLTFSDLKSDLPRVAPFPTAGQGERTLWHGYEVGNQLEQLVNRVPRVLSEDEVLVL